VCRDPSRRPVELRYRKRTHRPTSSPATARAARAAGRRFSRPAPEQEAPDPQEPEEEGDVDRHHPPAQVIRHQFLQQRIRGGVLHHEGEPDPDQEQDGGGVAPAEGEGEQQDGERQAPRRDGRPLLPPTRCEAE